MSDLKVEQNDDGSWSLFKREDGQWWEVSEHETKGEARRAQQDYLVAEQYA